MTPDMLEIRRADTHGDRLVAVFPAEVDISNADQLREALLRALNGNVRILIIDMSTTTFCDVSGVHVLERAHQRAHACGTELRLVVTAPIVRRVLMLNGLHRIFAIYPSLSSACPDQGAVRRRALTGLARRWRSPWFTRG